MITREQLHTLVEELPETELAPVADFLLARRDPESPRPDDIVDEWGNLSALRRALSAGNHFGPRGNFSGLLGRLSRDEIAELGETISDSFTRIEHEKRRARGTPETRETPAAPAATMRRGEIWWYKHPDFKRRPALILGPDPAIDGLDYTYVVLATTTTTAATAAKTRATKTTRLNLPTEIALSPQDGMPNVCFLAADQIDIAEEICLTSPITTLGAETISEVSRALTSVPTR